MFVAVVFECFVRLKCTTTNGLLISTEELRRREYEKRLHLVRPHKRAKPPSGTSPVAR